MTKAKVLILQRLVDGRVESARAFWTHDALRPIAAMWIRERWLQPPMMFTVDYYLELLMRDGCVDLGDTRFQIEEMEVE